MSIHSDRCFHVSGARLSYSLILYTTLIVESPPELSECHSAMLLSEDCFWESAITLRSIPASASETDNMARARRVERSGYCDRYLNARAQWQWQFRKEARPLCDEGGKVSGRCR